MSIEYIKFVDGAAVKTSLSMLRKENKDISFPKEPSQETLNEYGFFVLFEEKEPKAEKNEVVTKDAQPTAQPDGTYLWGWTVRSKSQEEISAENKEEKDLILARLGGSSGVIKILLDVAFDQENRIRVLEKEAPIDRDTFMTFVRGLVG